MLLQVEVGCRSLFSLVLCQAVLNHRGGMGTGETEDLNPSWPCDGPLGGKLSKSKKKQEV